MMILGKKIQLTSKVFALAVLLLTSFVQSADDLDVKLKGFGFVRVGQIQHVSDTLNYNFTGNWMQQASAQITAAVTVDDHWEGALGVGAGQEHRMQGRTSGLKSEGLVIKIQPYITQANIVYTHDNRESPKFQMTLGYFPFNYNPDIKNLGLYLLRGTVYPGYLISGFETKETMPIANLLGAKIHSNFGMFKQDVILTSEVENRPYLDYSLAYVGQLNFSEGLFNIGAGFNLYHYLPINGDLTTPTDTNVFSEKGDQVNFTVEHPYDQNYFIVDTTTGSIPGDTAAWDTIIPSHKGIKLNAFFSFNLGKLIGSDLLGEEDLKLYGEFAVIGVKNYPIVYDKISERIPFMIGFNIPTFRFLDHLSFEIEYYGARYQNNLEGVNGSHATIPWSSLESGRAAFNATRDSIIYDGQAYPAEDPYYLNDMTKDNIKWSLHGAKTIGGHLKFSAQIANDHFRPKGTSIAETHHTAFSTLDDWYWMAKFSYFF